jgi:hypothetical protein
LQRFCCHFCNLAAGLGLSRIDHLQARLDSFPNWEEKHAEVSSVSISNPAIDTPANDGHTFTVKYQVGRAAHACVYFHRKLSERLL